MARRIAVEMVKWKDVFNGGQVFMGKPVMTDRELIGAARCALQLVESGAVK